MGLPHWMMMVSSVQLMNIDKREFVHNECGLGEECKLYVNVDFPIMI
jgi:hypothetical protein